MRKLRSLAVGGAVLALAGVDGAMADDRATCFGGGSEAKARIAACERLIMSGNARGPDLAAAYAWRGSGYSDLGQIDAAIAELDESIRLNPRFETYSNRGLAYARKGDNDRAIADFDEAIRRNPKAAMAYANRGSLYGRKGNDERAIVDLTEAIRLDPKIAFAHNNRGLAYARKGDHDRAIADFTAAIRIDGKAVQYENRALSYEAKDELQKALADYRQTVRLDPANEAAKRSIAQIEQRSASAPSAQRPAVASPALQPTRPPQTAAAAANAAGATSVQALLEKRGLLGIWAVDCSQPASRTNVYAVYRPLDTNHVQRDLMAGPTDRSAAGVVNAVAEQSASDLLMDITNVTDVSMRSDQPIRDSLVVRFDGSRMRVWERVRNGVKDYADGRQIRSNEETPWFSKCQ